MIAALHGTVTSRDAAGAVIECGGVGYGVSMSLSSLAQLPEVGAEARVLVYTHVAQDVLRLFGFCTPAERDTFRVLISLSRVGPKLAIAVLSAMSPGELALVVEHGDLSALSRVPGVGKKTAERLLLELRDKLPAVVTADRLGAPADLRTDLVSALVNLGYDDDDAARAAQLAQDALPEERDVALLVREALRKTTRR